MSDPLAYLITWTVKGAWLHGDARGSVDRNQHRVGEPWLSPNPERQRWEEQVLASETNTLTSTEREAVESAIRQVCVYRRWNLLAIAVRTNHVHVVVCGDAAPERMMNDFKAYASRSLNGGKSAGKRWTRHGSTRYLNSNEAVESAIHYVVEGQGAPSPPQQQDPRKPDRNEPPP